MSRPATSEELRIARQLRPDLSWEDAGVNEGGQFHKVVIANPHSVIRMARTPQASAQMPRSVKLLEQLSGQLEYQIPVATSQILQVDGLSSVAMSFVPGSAHEPHYGDPKVLGKLVNDLAAVELEPLSKYLAEPFAFRGEWTEKRQQQCFDALPDQLRGAARRLWAQLDELAQVPPGLVHGDLAGHNMHWVGEELIGILDWDLAAAWDPALNTAYLSLWHGLQMVDLIAPNRDEAYRATIWLGLMSLERLSDTLLRADDRNIDKLIDKIGPRILEAAQAVKN
ncbi:aminoglycoside phosphotransferase family protein [Glutamicibacter sp. M10]|uniref:aminoglycoside phosphotransferase family protein n=1 Tax=Glutamicibacter sp. M10 TaxID=3023076 RepID=UPI0021C8022A|nr:aminoglycoside phosphotransferase family protein [Glutamicibacter sp. M10]UXN31698.1 aminoglycoside phosphotransferase family protein [Glutamicibacter sp. M10]